MDKKRKINTRMIASTGLLLAVEIILQVLSFIVPGTVNINLSLIPITIGAVMFGPIVGGFLGLVNGVIILCSPNTISVFMAINPGATVLTCLTKALLAGILAGFASKLLKNNLIGSIVASIIVPVINTLMFAMYCYFFFKDGLKIESFAAIFTVLIGVNFLFEIVINVVIVPILARVLHQLRKNEVNNSK